MSTEIMIDGALIILAALYLFVGIHWFRWNRKLDREHAAEMAQLEKAAARARQVREFAEQRFWGPVPGWSSRDETNPLGYDK
jgi:hypothetical protein